jgi:hypothetical protein
VITYESDKDAEELDDVGVSDAVKTPEESVENGDAGTENHTRTVVHVNNDAQRSPCGTSHVIPKSEFTIILLPNVST